MIDRLRRFVADEWPLLTFWVVLILLVLMVMVAW